MPEPLPAEVVAARLAETLALCGWEGTDVESLLGKRLLRFTARPLPPVRPVASPYGAASSLTRARERVRDRTAVITARIVRETEERRAASRLALGFDPSAGEVIDGQVSGGPCTSCDGTGSGGPASGPETNGRCWDCRGTGEGP